MKTEKDEKRDTQIKFKTGQSKLNDNHICNENYDLKCYSLGYNLIIVIVLNKSETLLYLYLLNFISIYPESSIECSS